MDAQSNMNVRRSCSANKESKFQSGAECCCDSGFNSETNQAIDDLFGVATRKGTFFGRIKLLIMATDRLKKIAELE
jgi:hypothetical protein